MVSLHVADIRAFKTILSFLFNKKTLPFLRLSNVNQCDLDLIMLCGTKFLMANVVKFVELATKKLQAATVNLSYNGKRFLKEAKFYYEG